jgi:hypothetical protein
VHEEQVDLVDAEMGHRLVEGPLERLGCVVAVGQLAGDVDLLAGNPGLGDRLPDAGLGAVSLCGVDVAVARLAAPC